MATIFKNDKIEFIRTQKGETLEYFHEGENEYLQSPTKERYSVSEGIICFLEHSSLDGNNKNYQKMYDRFSGFYDVATRIFALLRNGKEKKRLMQYLSLLNIKEGDKVMEIAVGTGRNIKYLNPDADFYGIDISLGMLRLCQRKMKRLRREITLIQAEAEFLPVKDESFDVVFSAGGFNFFNDPGKAVVEMLRIAKSGVKILITDETEKLRMKFKKNEFYKNNEIKNPVHYLPDYCKDIEYKEICKGDLYVLTFRKP
ncbi:MAG: methyltransferase domain-containing protein [Bacteroidales bacterium]|jgi:ubiquinone/menaquinone biosynthesis C-methylase UbiE